MCLNFNFLGDWGVFHSSQNLKCQDLSKFQFFGRWGCSIVVKIQNAKICLNFNFPEVGVGMGCSVVVKTQSAKICLNFNFERGVCSIVVKTQSTKICPNFSFQGRGVFCTKSQNRVFLLIWAKILLDAFWKPLHGRQSLTYYVCGD